MKPIIFSTPMVQAILNGRKTMTRRVIPALSGKDAWFVGRYRSLESPPGKRIMGEHFTFRHREDAGAFRNEHIPLRYSENDILWVRETWSPVHVLPKRYLYKADAENGGEGDGLPIRWRPSIHMPREAARLFLRVTGVRVERLKEITLDDIEREGLYCDTPYTREHFAYGPGMSIHWVKLWDSINAKRNGGAYAYDKNPWVWVYSFERVDKPAGWPSGEVE